MIYDSLDISLKYKQEIITADFKSGNNTILQEGFNIEGISSVVLKKDALYLPDGNKSMKVNDITSVGIYNGRNYNTILIGAGLGLAAGLIAGFIYGASYHSEGFMDYSGAANAVLIGFGLTIAGAVVGLNVAPAEYREYDLRKYDDSAKKQKLIEAFKKSKIQNL